jgi:hypothetical protein
MEDEIKDFDLSAGLDEPPSGEFKAGGQTWHIRASIPIMPFTSAFAVDAEGKSRIQIERLIEMCIVPEETEELMKLLNDPAKSPITNRNMEEFFNFIMEKAGKAPSGESSSSSNGSKTNGRTSGVRSSSAGGRRKPLPPSR